jgi:hypothetical protein
MLGSEHDSAPGCTTNSGKRSLIHYHGKRTTSGTTTEKRMTNGQMTMLGLFSEYDIKGTLSGKFKIYEMGGRPVDALGYMLQRLGYTGHHDRDGTDPDGRRGDPYNFSAQELGISIDALRMFYNEIDRSGSTNATIKQMFHRVTGIPG